MKLNDILKKMKETEEKRSERDRNISKTQAELRSLEQKKAAALSAGDKKQFKELSEEADDKAIDLKILESTGFGLGISAAAIDDSWKDYAADHDRELAKKLERVSKQRDELKKSVEDVFRFQNDALKTREELCSYLGEGDLGRFSLANIPNETRPFRRGMVYNPEVLYLTYSGAWPCSASALQPDAIQDAHTIINYGRSVSKFTFD